MLLFKLPLLLNKSVVLVWFRIVKFRDIWLMLKHSELLTFSINLITSNKIGGMVSENIKYHR